MVKRQFISICITVMNRVHHLRETLPHNLNCVKKYKAYEFVILDYNSTDDLDILLNNNFKNNKIRYIKQSDVNFFNPSHAKNLAMANARGSILCNLNVDHFIDEDFLEKVNFLFYSSSKPIVLTPLSYEIENTFPPDLYGLVCVRKIDFFRVNGFDERMNCFEDHDFINRLELLGVQRTGMRSFDLRYISHSNNDRFPLLQIINEIESVYLEMISPFKSNILVLKKNGTFEQSTILEKYGINSDNLQNAYTSVIPKYRYDILPSSTVEGCWQLIDSVFYFYGINRVLFMGKLRNNNGRSILVVNGKSHYLAISSMRLIEEYINFKRELSGRLILEDNLLNKTIVANPYGGPCCTSQMKNNNGK